MSSNNYSPIHSANVLIKTLMSLYLDESASLQKLNIERLRIVKPNELNKLKGEKKNQEFLKVNNYFKQEKIESHKSAALFSYSYSLFERNLVELLLNTIRTDKEIRQRYFGKWNKFFDEGHHKKFDGLTSEILRDEEAQIENYEILIKNEKSSYEKFLSSLLSLKQPTKGVFTWHRANFAIFREIRNLIVHRGDEIDAKLLQSLSRNGYLKKNPKRLDDFYEELTKRENFRREYFHTHTINLKDTEISTDEIELKLIKEKKDLVGSRIDINYHKAISSLIFLTCWYNMHLAKNEEGSSGFGEIFHEIISANDEIQNPIFCELVSEIFRVQSKYIFDYDLLRIPDVNKFNFFLALSQKEEIAKKYKNKELISTMKEQHSLNYDKYFHFNEEFVDNKFDELLEAYIKNNKNNFFEVLKNMNLTNNEYDHWYIFKKWKNDKRFKEIKS
ncbi:hypothetical protein N9C79_02615 [Acidimicrobiia bacterium]|nr:hypothetical protein [Acidimicrobiia bacterium]